MMTPCWRPLGKLTFGRRSFSQPDDGTYVKKGNTMMPTTPLRKREVMTGQMSLTTSMVPEPSLTKPDWE